jgi:IclR family pca regulon transcriptional regulator
MKTSAQAPEGEKSRYNIDALARGLEILALFSKENGSLSMSEIVASLGLNKSTAFRMLSTLETMGYLERDPSTRRYRPSVKVLQLGFAAINGLEFRQVARPFLERLAGELNETITLGVLNGANVFYVDRIRNQAIVGVLLNIGSRLPAHCTTVGRVLLSGLAPDEIKRFLETADLRRYTPRTITSPDALLSEVAAVRRNGYAICDQELAVGLRAAGAPIRDRSGKIVAAINATGSMMTISLQRLRKEIVPAVVRTAREISLSLGYVPWQETGVRGARRRLEGG